MYYTLYFAILSIHRQVCLALNVYCFTNVIRIMFCLPLSHMCTAIRILCIVPCSLYRDTPVYQCIVPALKIMIEDIRTENTSYPQGMCIMDEVEQLVE